MALACQRESYLQQFSTVVKTCEPAELTTQVNGKKQKLPGFEVILEDTILFPEGGGQPDDRGKINNIDVLRITRRGTDAVHFVPTPLDPGVQVQLEVDWVRRFDHMQQHSGQHLVTAIADGKYGYKTTSWNLGDKTSFIELDTPGMTAKEMEELESVVNQKIREGIPMYPTLFESKNDPEIQKVRTRGLPDDHEGPVRIVTIEGIEANMCCGTHVSNLSHLQAIKLLAVEKGKKGKCNLVFVAGNRVLDYLGKCYNNEKALNNLLRGPPEEHIELVEKMQKNMKTAQKSALTVLRDLAVLEAQRFKNDPNKDSLFILHRKEGDNEFMNIIVNEIGDEKILKFLSVGDEKGSGNFLLAGPEDVIAKIGSRVAEILDGKGAGKKGKFQGKANKLGNRAQVEQLLQDIIGSGDH